MPSGPDKDFFEGLYQSMRGRAAGMAERFKPGYGSKELDGDDLETLWNRRAMSIEQEWALHRELNQDGTPAYTREQIGLQVFPDREKLAKSGGRVEPREFISWTNAMARRMEKKRAERAQVSAAPLIEEGY